MPNTGPATNEKTDQYSGIFLRCFSVCLQMYYYNRCMFNEMQAFMLPEAFGGIRVIDMKLGFRLHLYKISVE